VVDELIGLADAAALVPDGATISFGGFTTQRHPMAFVEVVDPERVFLK